MALRRYFGKISPLAIGNLVGHNGELVIDETTDYVYVMDGITPGGQRILYTNVNAAVSNLYANVNPSINNQFTLGNASNVWTSLYVTDIYASGNLFIDKFINPTATNNSWGNLIINANRINADRLYAQTDITTDGSINANTIFANGFVEINAANYTGFTFSGLGSSTTGLIHANVGSVSTVAVTSNGNASLTSYANGYNTIGGYTQFYQNVYITGNNLTVPTNTTIGLLPTFNPSGAKLTHVDNVNSYAQFLLQNKNSGSSASGDIVVTADNGTDSTYYIDMGINSSTFSGGGGLDAANDGYLLVEGGKLVVATLNSGKDIVFAIGGDAAANEIGRFKSGNGLVVTGNVTVSGNLNVTGNITTTNYETVSKTEYANSIIASGNITASGYLKADTINFGGYQQIYTSNTATQNAITVTANIANDINGFFVTEGASAGAQVYTEGGIDLTVNTAGAGGPSLNYSFGTTGILSLPYSNYIESVDTNLHFGAGDDVVIRSNAADQTGGLRSWTFGKNGNLTVPGNISISGNIIPTGNAAYSLGTLDHQWKSLYVSNNTIYIGGTAIQVANGSLIVGGNVVSGSGSTYSNANVAAYLPTNSTITNINANITSANSAISTINANVVAANSAISTLTSNAATQANLISTINSNITAANSAISTINSNVTAANSAITTLYSNAAIQANLISNLSANITSANSAISTINSNVTAANSAITTLYSNAASQASDINTLYNNAGVQANSLTTLNNSLINLAAIVSQIQAGSGFATTQQIQAANSSITTLNANLDAANLNITNLQSNTGTIASNVNLLFTNAATQASLINTINANIIAANSVISTLTSNAASQATDITTLYSNASTQANLIAAINSNVSAANSAIVTANSAVTAYATSLNSAMTANITAANANLGALTGRVVVVEGNIVSINNILLSIINGAFSYSNANVATYLPTYSGNLSAGNITVNGNLFVTGNITTQNYETINNTEYANSIIASGNITASGNVRAGNVQATTAVYANAYYWYNNGAPFSSGTYSNTNVGYYLNSNLITSTISLTGNVIANAVYANSFLYSNGVAYSSGGGSNYGNTQVGYYLNSNVITSNISGTGYMTAGNLVANTGVYGNSYYWYNNNATLASTITGTYSNSNVAGYLPTYTANISAGNINLTANGNIIGGTSTTMNIRSFGVFNVLTITATAGGYNSPPYNQTLTGGSGTGFTAYYSTAGNGYVNVVYCTNPGTGYKNGDVLTLPGGLGTTVTLSNYNPNLTNSKSFYWAFSAYDGNLTVPGNIQLPSNSYILGDFTNSNVAYRTFFQTTTANATTGIYAAPTGTATGASWQALNANATYANNASKILIATNGSTDVQLVSGINGTGTYLPLSFYNNGAAQMVLYPNGNINMSNANPITTTGNVSVGNLIAASTGNIYGNASAATLTSAANGVGYMGMPQNSQSGSTYAVAIGDAGKHLYFTSATVTATIPANSATAFPIGTTIAFVASSATTLTIAITTDTMYLAGTGTTGSRTLAAYGMATAVKVAATTWFISGIGLT